MNKKILFVFFYFIFTIKPLIAIELAKPNGWIADYAGILDSESYREINGVITDLEKKTGAEISVVSIKSLEGDSIENFSVKLFEKWGIGKKGKDNGVLLLTSIEDRKVRIEVGYGLEGILPDGLCGEIIDTYIIPHFNKGIYGKGISLGVIAVASVIAKDAGVELSGGTIIVEQKGKVSLLGMILRILFFIMMIILFIRHPFLFLLFLGMSGGRGRSGGGFSGGFGGFGGGMSGGGGASRGW